MSDLKIHRSPAHFSTLHNSMPLFSIIPSQNRNYIIKRVTTQDPEVLTQAVKQVISNSNHQHPNILPYTNSQINYGESGWLVEVRVRKMEKNLFDILHSKMICQVFFSKYELLTHFYFLIKGLEYLHKASLPHQNLKHENILYDSKGMIYLTDCQGQINRADEQFVTALKNQKGHDKQLNAMNKESQAYSLMLDDCFRLGLIFLDMANIENFNKSNVYDSEFINRRLQKVKAHYGEDVSNLISSLLEASVAGHFSLSQLRESMESQYSREKNTLVLNHNGHLMLPLNQRVNLQTQPLPLFSKKYLPIPAADINSLSMISKYGVLEKRRLNLLKRCFKLGTCSNMKNIGKKIEFTAFDTVQYDNRSRLADGNKTQLSKIQQLCTSVSSFTNIKDYQIEFTSENITFNDLATFGQRALKLKQVRKLKLGFTCGQSFCDKGLILLSKMLKRFQNLEMLNLYMIKWARVTDAGIEYFCQSLLRLKKLKRFALNLEEFPQIGTDSVLKLGYYLSKLQHLEDVDLTFLRCDNIAGQQLSILSSQIANIKSLKSVGVNMKQSQCMMNHGLSDLSKALTSFEELRELKLNFLSCELNEIGINALSNSLQNLTSLTTLELIFGNNDKITVPCFLKISESLGRLLHLRNLKLVLFQCDQLNDEAMQYLSDSLEKLSTLVDLELNLRWCMKITDEGLSKLSNAFLSLKNLNKIALSLDGCRIGDVGVSKLGLNLAKLEYLNSLKLEVRECKGIHGSGISTLGECLTKLVKLGQLQLNFCGCGGTGTYRQRFNEGISSLKKSISKLPKVHLDENTLVPYFLG